MHHRGKLEAMLCNSIELHVLKQMYLTPGVYITQHELTTIPILFQT